MDGRMQSDDEKQGTEHKKGAAKRKSGKPGGKQDEY
jgi:hypothetical protein